MATKPRAKKTPLQLWIVDSRKRLGMTPADLARTTGVSEDTARAWESRGRPGADALAILERLFGSAAPDGDQMTGADLSGVVAAIDRLTAAVELQGRQQQEGMLSLASVLGEVMFALGGTPGRTQGGSSGTRSEAGR